MRYELFERVVSDIIGNNLLTPDNYQEFEAAVYKAASILNVQLFKRKIGYLTADTSAVTTEGGETFNSTYKKGWMTGSLKKLSDKKVCLERVFTSNWGEMNGVERFNSVHYSTEFNIDDVIIVETAIPRIFFEENTKNPFPVSLEKALQLM